MKKELDDQLCKEFPNLYADRNKSSRETNMCWGFTCQDGWFDIIYDLSSKLEAEILKQENKVDYKAAQCKEKFGSLRFYLTRETETMTKLIAEAEEQSSKTCEICGKEGKLRQGTWYYTLCDVCNILK